MGRWLIPKGWCWAIAADIASIIGGGTPSTKNPANFTKNGIPWITPADLSRYQDEYIARGRRDLSNEGYSSSGAQLMPKGSVLFTSRAPVGYCVIAANEICTNQGFKSMIIKGSISPKYIRHYLLYSKEYAESLASGSTFKELSGKRMATLEFPIPPLNEQKRIVTKIEELQAHSRQTREALETIPEMLEQLRQSILSAAFKGDLTKAWREKNSKNLEPASELLQRIRSERQKRWEEAELGKLKVKGFAGDKLKDEFAKCRKKYKEPEPVDAATLPELPEGWCSASIDTIAFVTKLAGFEYTKYVEYDPSGDLPVIKAENAGKHGFKRTEFSKVKSDTIQHLSRSKVIGGDLLMVFVGAGVGQVARVPDDQEYFLGPNIAMIRVESRSLVPEFVEFFLRSEIGFSITMSFTKAVAQPSLSMGEIRKISLIIPPISEQKLIVENLKKYFLYIEELEKKIDVLERSISNMDQAILSKAFSGELVLQDPNDEPASILLERIRQEKAQQLNFLD